jgi:hypothetical protein
MRVEKLSWYEEASTTIVYLKLSCTCCQHDQSSNSNAILLKPTATQTPATPGVSSQSGVDRSCRVMQKAYAAASIALS